MSTPAGVVLDKHHRCRTLRCAPWNGATLQWLDQQSDGSKNGASICILHLELPQHDHRPRDGAGLAEFKLDRLLGLSLVRGWRAHLSASLQLPRSSLFLSRAAASRGSVTRLFANAGSSERYNISGAYRKTAIDRSNAWGGSVLEGWSIGKPLIADDGQTVCALNARRRQLAMSCI